MSYFCSCGTEILFRGTGQQEECGQPKLNSSLIDGIYLNFACGTILEGKREGIQTTPKNNSAVAQRKKTASSFNWIHGKSTKKKDIQVQ
jgi:hypothetical protein